MSIDPLVIRYLTLRMQVAFAGETGQLGWWPSQSLSTDAAQLWESVFGVATPAVALNLSSQIACQIHDKWLSGMDYHLFRLPEGLEEALYTAALHLPTADATALLAERATLLTAPAPSDTIPAAGPLHLGTCAELLDGRAISRLHHAYAVALKARQAVFPYFTEA